VVSLTINVGFSTIKIINEPNEPIADGICHLSGANYDDKKMKRVLIIYFHTLVIFYWYLIDEVWCAIDELEKFID